MPKYEVKVEDTVSRSCYIVVEAPNPDTAEAKLRALFDEGGEESYTILNLLSDNPDDITT